QAIARHRPHAHILGVTPDSAVARQLNLVWGVSPMVIPLFAGVDQLVEYAVAAAREAGSVARGDRIVVVAGIPAGSPTNLIHLLEV
ncbi:MAG: pyruvate kinase alpha/beta domain-containing protein, partial [Candidatus Eremiobacterota bacterium]